MFQVKMPAVRRKCRYLNAGGGILNYQHFSLAFDATVRHSINVNPIKLDAMLYVYLHCL